LLALLSDWTSDLAGHDQRDMQSRFLSMGNATALFNEVKSCLVLKEALEIRKVAELWGSTPVF